VQREGADNEVLLVYNFILTILSPIWVPWMWLRTVKRKEQPNWKERFGDFEIQPRKDRKRIWVHAVSVGEVVASPPILKEIRSQLPDHEIILTTTTSSGHQTARDTAKDLYDQLFYFPIDVNRFMGAAMQRVQPSVVAVMETELWPNFLWWAKVFDAKTLLINGRISDSSFKRSKSLKPLYAAMLANVDSCLMQTEHDAERIKALGARSAEVMGNAKFDQAAKVFAQPPQQLKAELGFEERTPVVVIGSTRGDEEEAFVVNAIKQLSIDVNVIHAPRHIERAPELMQLLKKEGFAPALRSAQTHQTKGTNYWVLDTYGELDRMYSIADVVVIGGGFANFGGQNLIQPLAQGKPVLHGPHMQNFREETSQADECGAAIRVDTPEKLASAIMDILPYPEKARQMGDAARKLVKTNLGASKRYAAGIAAEAMRFHEEESHKSLGPATKS